MKRFVLLGCLAAVVLACALFAPPKSGLQGILLGGALLVINVAAVVGIRPKGNRS